MPALGAAVVQGQADAAMVEAVGQCQLNAQGLPTLFSFLDPAEGVSLPPELTELVGLPMNTYWVKGSLADDRPGVLARIQTALLQAGLWASDPANVDRVASILRASPYNLQALSNEQWVSCVGSVVSHYTLSFGTDAGTRWVDVLRTFGTPVDVPSPKQWIASGVVARRGQAAAMVRELDARVGKP